MNKIERFYKDMQSINVSNIGKLEKLRKFLTNLKFVANL